MAWANNHAEIKIIVHAVVISDIIQHFTQISWLILYIIAWYVQIDKNRDRLDYVDIMNKID